MIELQVVTPERHLLKATCENVTLPGALGEFEVLEGHTPVLAALKSGILSFSSKAESVRLMISEGYVEVGPGHVTVLVEAAAFASEINVETEKALLDKFEEAKRRLTSEDVKEFKRIEAEIERSTAKIRLM